MLAYYPLEHISYLCSHGIISSAISLPHSLFPRFKSPVILKPATLGMWSCRFWALYVVLQFAHLREDRKLLQLRQRSLRKAKGTGLTSSEKEELQHRWDAYWNEMVVNIGNLPLAVHWYVSSTRTFRLLIFLGRLKRDSLETRSVTFVNSSSLFSSHLLRLDLGQSLWPGYCRRIFQERLESH